MLRKSWHTSILVIALSTCGCAWPGRQQTAQGTQSNWGLFQKPAVSYAEGENQDDDFPVKEIKDPNPLRIRYAQWMEETGNVNDAQKQYQQVIKEQPKNVEAQLGLARIDLAQGRTDAAEQSFHKILKNDRDNAGAHAGLGMCLAIRKEWPEAVEELTKGLQGHPEDKTIRYQLAVALVHTGDLAAAQVQFTDCVGEAAGHYNTALILKDEGNLSEAEAQLQLALRKDPKLKDAQRWLAEIRKARNQVSRINLEDTAEEIRPDVRPVKFQDYGQVGSVSVEPAVYIPEEQSGTPPPDGHSTSQTNE